MNTAANDDQLAELEAAAIAARQRIDFLWRAKKPDWLAIGHAVDDLSSSVGLIVAEQGLDADDDRWSRRAAAPFHRRDAGERVLSIRAPVGPFSRPR